MPAEQQPELQKGDTQCSQTPKALAEKQSTGLSIDTREPAEGEARETERPSVQNQEVAANWVSKARC